MNTRSYESWVIMDNIDKNLIDLAELFKVYADSTRIRIIKELFDLELCVSELVEALDMNQSAISHQLRILKNAKLVKTRREGKRIYYSLDDDHVKVIFEAGYSHVLHRYVK